MGFISERKICTRVEYHVFYETSPGSGFSFPCDENGHVSAGQLQPEALVNYEKCLSGVVKPVVQTLRWSYTEPAIIRCACGAEVELHGFTNTCAACHADYNMSGQQLADRSQWGEETGETLSDILSADASSYDIDY